MNSVISYIVDLHPLSFMGYYVLSTTVIYILLNIIIAKTRPTENTTAVPEPYSISPSFLAWLRNSATSVIQLAMFRLLRKNYVTLIHSAENIQLCANQQYAECKMTCVEKILFDHFATPKSSHQDLPLSLHVAEHNHWTTDPQCNGLRLSPTQQTWNMILVVAPSLVLITVLAWKTFFDNQAMIHSSVLSWLAMFIVSGLWWLWLLCITLNATRLDREGISINILDHYIATLKETLIADADTLTDENADYCVAIGTTTLLPERFGEYIKVIKLIQYPFCLQRLD
ncbi:hypothetical protein [Klebsiella africana]|uniref:TIGR04222 domain n=2 Tax=Klebsiella africana TaxID=2489010 RepID=A0A8B6ITW9_9ENTR|nr:hypothetical protein [Klebsiella africana]UDD42108.1 hypothetical protein LGL98_09415 [Klebsiella africana]USB42891.1 hypothetical protein KU660_09270 [Klebsiella africana]VGP99962.1 hypothetical protein SB5857_03189 [Klebsiella africana]